MTIIPISGSREVPARIHQMKNWMTAAYHRRIQKKWLKRFGMSWIEILSQGQILISPDGNIFCRQEDYQALTKILAIRFKTSPNIANHGMGSMPSCHVVKPIGMAKGNGPDDGKATNGSTAGFWRSSIFLANPVIAGGAGLFNPKKVV